MANKRIKDLATTATAPAVDDFLALDGATNLSRKIDANKFLVDAPSDGDLYGRKDGAWAEAASPTDIPLVPSFVYDGTAEATAFVVGDIPEDYAPSNTDITQLYLGNGVTTIGDDAFNGCTGLAGALVIPDSVTSIGDYAFNGCTGLAGALVIPDSVTSIGSYAFSSNSLTSVTIPNSVTSIGGSAFDGNALTTVILAEGRTTIPQFFAFPNYIDVGFAGVLTIPNSVTSIGDYAFSSNALTSVTIGNSVTSIGDNAFSYNSLTSVTIGNSVTSIGSYAFSNNALTSVTIPASVTTIGIGAFAYNSTLATVNCFITKTIIDAGEDMFLNTASPLTINVPTSGAVADTWTAGTGLSIGGNTNVTVAKNL